MELSVTAAAQPHDAGVAWRERCAQAANPPFAHILRETQLAGGNNVDPATAAGAPKGVAPISGTANAVAAPAHVSTAGAVPQRDLKSEAARRLAVGHRRASPEPTPAHAAAAPSHAFSSHLFQGALAATSVASREIRRTEGVAAKSSEPDDGGRASLQVSLGDAPVGGVAVTSLPGGALALRIGVTPSRTGNLSRELEELRRRLEAKGLTVDEIVVADISDERELLRG